MKVSTAASLSSSPTSSISLAVVSVSDARRGETTPATSQRLGKRRGNEAGGCPGQRSTRRFIDFAAAVDADGPFQGTLTSASADVVNISDDFCSNSNGQRVDVAINRLASTDCNSARRRWMQRRPLIGRRRRLRRSEGGGGAALLQMSTDVASASASIAIASKDERKQMKNSRRRGGNETILSNRFGKRRKNSSK